MEKEILKLLTSVNKEDMILGSRILGERSIEEIEKFFILYGKGKYVIHNIHILEIFYVRISNSKLFGFYPGLREIHFFPHDNADTVYELHDFR